MVARVGHKEGILACGSVSKQFEPWCFVLCSVTRLCPTFYHPMDCSTPGLPVPNHLSEFAQVHGRCLSEAIQPFHPLLPPSPFALNFSQHQGLFQRVSSLHQVAKIQSTKYRASSNSSSSEHPGLISFRTDWFDLLAVQGILKSLLQHHKLKASILHHSAFFMNELSHLYLTTGKTKLDRPSLA